MEEWKTEDLIEIKNDYKKLAQEQAEKIESLEKEIDKLKGFNEYLQTRNKYMVHINGWHMETNKHLKEKIEELERVSLETRGLAYEKIQELTKYTKVLENRINKVTEQCAVNWINEILKGE